MRLFSSSKPTATLDAPDVIATASDTRDYDPWWTALIFGAGYLLLGMLDAGLSFAFAKYPATAIAPGAKLPPIWPPEWVFWSVWLVIYPGKGVAIWSVWRLRRKHKLQAFTWFVLLLLFMDLAFLPISALTNNNPAILSLMDASGIIFLPLTIWIYGRYSKTALLWLIPIFIWGPFTLFIKVWLWWLNGGNGAI